MQETNTRSVLITGASRGIGKAIRDVLTAARQYTLWEPTRQEMDLEDGASIDRYLGGIPGIDILVNNAGINILAEAGEIDDDAFHKMVMVNLEAPLKIIRRVVPHMKSQKFGRIINISSIFGVRSKELRTLYSMTKFGLNGITRALAREFGGYNILVNSVCPGYTNTELTRKNVPPSEQDQIRKTIPLGRFAEPEEIALFVKFLISPENTYITGQTLVIDGGFLA